MNPVSAFLSATAVAYLACVFYTLIGKPPLASVGKVQAVFYMVIYALFLVVLMNPNIKPLNFCMGILYGFASVGSFVGYPSVWAAYWTSNPKGGSAAQQVMMSAWDVLLSVAFFSLC